MVVNSESQDDVLEIVNESELMIVARIRGLFRYHCQHQNESVTNPTPSPRVCHEVSLFSPIWN